MLRLYFIFVAATIVNSVPYFNDLGEDVGSLQNAPVYNEDVDNSDRLSNTNVNPVDDSFANFENTVPLNIALDQCDPNSQGKGSGACRSNVELAPKTPVYTGDTPQSPRSGVSPMPGIIPGANKRPSDRECVNFEGRPVFASCGGPEFYTEGDLAYDSIVVMNCVPKSVNKIKKRGIFEAADKTGKYCCSWILDSGPEYRAGMCATLAPSEPTIERKLYSQLKGWKEIRYRASRLRLPEEDQRLPWQKQAESREHFLLRLWRFYSSPPP